MIRYQEASNKKIEWSVVRTGKNVAEGIADCIEDARSLAEKAVLDSFNAEKIDHVILCGVGESQLTLLKSTK